MFTQPFEVAEKWLRRGGKIVTVGSDYGFIANGAATAVSGARKVIDSL